MRACGHMRRFFLHFPYRSLFFPEDLKQEHGELAEGVKQYDWERRKTLCGYYKPSASRADNTAAYAPNKPCRVLFSVCRSDRIGRLTDERIELDDGTISTLNDKLNYAVSLSDEQPEISVTYFKPDSKKNGGEYVTHTGVIKRVDEYERKLIFTDKTVILIDDIYEIDSEIYDGIY